MKEETWINQLKNRLKGQDEPLPSGGWERLEQELAASATPAKDAVPEGRLLPLRRLRLWGVAAALLVAVWGITFWLMQSPAVQEVGRIPLPVTAVQTETEEPVSLPKVEALPSSQTSVLAQSAPVLRKAEVEGKQMAERSIAISEQEPPASECDLTAVPETPVPDNAQADNRPPKKTSLGYPAEPIPAKKKRGGWSVGLHVGNGLGASSLGSERDNMVQAPEHYFPMDEPTGGGYVDSGNEEDGEDKEDNPVTRTRNESAAMQRRSYGLKHKLPISVGITLRKELGKGFAVESGLVYTYLLSELEGTDLQQKLHYIGIPLRLSYALLERGGFMLYASAGGMVEKCVSGSVGGESCTVDALQLSVSGALGVQYNLSRRVGLYVEPGISRYFDDGSGVQTIRKENPCNFTLQGGIRLRY